MRVKVKHLMGGKLERDKRGKNNITLINSISFVNLLRVDFTYTLLEEKISWVYLDWLATRRKIADSQTTSSI